MFHAQMNKDSSLFTLREASEREAACLAVRSGGSSSAARCYTSLNGAVGCKCWGASGVCRERLGLVAFA